MQWIIVLGCLIVFIVMAMLERKERDRKEKIPRNYFEP